MFATNRRLWSAKDRDDELPEDGENGEDKEIVEGNSMDHSARGEDGQVNNNGRGTKTEKKIKEQGNIGISDRESCDETELSTDLEDEGELKITEEEVETTMMRYRIPFLLDLRKTATNPDEFPLKWLKKVLVVVQHVEKSAVILTRVQVEGDRKRYLAVHEIPGDVTGEMKVKEK